jgi:hypothetical protein
MRPLERNKTSAVSGPPSVVKCQVSVRLRGVVQSFLLVRLVSEFFFLNNTDVIHTPFDADSVSLHVIMKPVFDSNGLLISSVYEQVTRLKYVFETICVCLQRMSVLTLGLSLLPAAVQRY